MIMKIVLFLVGAIGFKGRLPGYVTLIKLSVPQFLNGNIGIITVNYLIEFLLD